MLRGVTQPPLHPLPAYLPFLDPHCILPSILYREVNNNPPTLEDFEPMGSEQPDELDFEERLRAMYGVSVFCDRTKVVARIAKMGSSGWIAKLDLRVARWARFGLMQRGPQFHFEMLGRPEFMMDTVVEVDPP